MSNEDVRPSVTPAEPARPDWKIETIGGAKIKVLRDEQLSNILAGTGDSGKRQQKSTAKGGWVKETINGAVLKVVRSDRLRRILGDRVLY